MLRNVLSLVAGIIALNILLLTWFAISSLRDAFRRRREIRELEETWETHRQGARDPSRSRPERLAGVILLTIVLGATSALASPQGRGVLTSVLDMVTRGLHGQPAEQEATPLDGGRSLAAAAGSDASPRASAGSLSGRDSARPSASPSTGHGSADPPPSNPPSHGPTVPVSPTAVTAVSISSGQIRVDWLDVSTESDYRVERSMDGVTGWMAVANVGQDVTTTVDEGLAGGTTYYYRVFATDPAGDSTASNVASATTSVDPATPTTVNAVAISTSQIELDWTDVGNETGYRVERMLAGDADWLTIATTGEDITHFTDAGLTAGTAYYYRVFATNPGGDSAPSDVVLATTSSDPIVEP